MSAPAILIAGGGVAGWTTALALARSLRGTGARIALIDTPGPDRSLGPLAPAIATLPSAQDAHWALGLPEHRVVRAGRGAYRLGESWRGWDGREAAAFLPFGEVGADIGGVRFHQQVARLQALGETASLADHALSSLAAAAGRFAIPPHDAADIRATLDHGLHLDAEALTGALLRPAALAMGVTRTEGGIAEVELSADGLIAALRIEDGPRQTADLFIDATGPDARLIGTLEAAWEDWTALSPFDRAAAVIRPDTTEPAPFTRDAAYPWGWRRAMPLNGARGEIVMFASRHMKDERASQMMGGAEPLPFRPGRRLAPWTGNCVAVGAAAAIPDPLASAELALVHAAALRLARLVPWPGGWRVEAEEFNRLWRHETESVRDFALLRHRLNRRPEPVWKAARESSAPEPMDRRLALFAARGRIIRTEHGLYDDALWARAFIALGARPRHHDPLADGLDAGMLKARSARIRELAARAAASMPRHGDFLARVNAPDGPR